MARNELAEKLEIIGSVFEIDGMAKMLNKFDKKMNDIKFAAVIIQIEGLLIKNNQDLANKIVALNKGITEEEVNGMTDVDYAQALKEAIARDVLGFFASSPSSEDKK